MKKLTLLLIALLLAACAPQGIQVPQSPALKIFERKSGQIAYIGADGNIYLTDQGATSNTQLTKDASPDNRATMAYQQPTWSHDGTQLAFIRLEKKGTGLITNIFVSNVGEENAHKIYTSEIEYPLFLYWSPDGATLTALTTTASKQTLALQSIPIDGGEPRVLDTGNPMYWSWAPDGKTMIVHKNGGNPNVPNQLSFLKLDEDVTEFVTEISPASFQAPAWSPDGAHILLTTLSKDKKQELVLADSTGAIQKSITTFDLNTSFAWASDSQQYAYIAGKEKMKEGSIGPLHVGNVQDDKEVVIDEEVFAFFWSPDALEVAYLVPYLNQPENSTDQVLIFKLHILDVASGESREIATFQPTQEFLAIVPYIDQYQQSTTIWSPDSNNLLVTFINTNGDPSIAIVPSSGITEPRILEQGSYATWSWK